uniref:Uncharacterized protein n=1 Tax=Sphaerodactylus townsendi TaxID=933632 RepID=A0ACB8FZK0_9SAUR
MKGKSLEIGSSFLPERSETPVVVGQVLQPAPPPVGTGGFHSLMTSVLLGLFPPSSEPSRPWPLLPDAAWSHLYSCPPPATLVFPWALVSVRLGWLAPLLVCP